MPALAVVLRAQSSDTSLHWNGVSLLSEPAPECIEGGRCRAVRVLGGGEAAEGEGDTVSPLASFVPTGGPTSAMPDQEDAG
jgi:hypothetical protein